MISPSDVLFIEPSAKVSSTPLIDELTRKMAAAYRQSTIGGKWMGFHTCKCGVDSDDADHFLPNGAGMTNSLCVHYLAFHRDEVPQEELGKVRRLDCGEAEPTRKELASPSTFGRLLIGQAFHAVNKNGRVLGHLWYKIDSKHATRLTGIKRLRLVDKAFEPSDEVHREQL